MNDCIEEVREHLLAAAIELLEADIAHAPNTSTDCLRSGYLSDIYRIAQRIAGGEWDS